MNRIALTFVILIVASAANAQQPACVRNADNAFEDIKCATAALKMAERELEGAYSRLLALLSPPEAAALRSAQNAWLNFAAANARFAETRKGRESPGRLAIANSREKLTRERTQELESWIPR